MMRFIVMATLLSFAAQVSAAELNESVIEAQKEYQVEIDEIVADAKRDVFEARLKLLKSLERELNSVSKKGDLAVAKAIQDRIDELSKPQDGKDLFGNDTNSDTSKTVVQDPQVYPTIKIRRAFLRSRERGRIEITEAVQDLVDAGQNKIVPSEKFADKIDVKNGVEFLAEIETDKGVKMSRVVWTQEIDLSTGIAH